MEDAGGGIAAALFGIIYLGVIVLCIASGWKVFVKAGKPGWAVLVPIYNIIVLLEIIGRPIWWIVLFLIPIVSLIVAILIYIDLAKSFGKGAGFGIGMILLAPIFWPMLAFGDATYQGPVHTA